MKIELKMKNYNVILTEKQKKYQRYHQTKFVNMNLTTEEILPSTQSQILGQTKFEYSALGKALEFQTKTNEDQEKTS